LGAGWARAGGDRERRRGNKAEGRRQRAEGFKEYLRDKGGNSSELGIILSRN
jgi:hypothetical protein